MTNPKSLDTTNLSRRAALKGLSVTAATGAVALPAMAAAVGAQPDDPMFAAIEAHRAAVREFNENCTKLSDPMFYEQTIAAGKPWPFPLVPGTPEAEAEYERLYEAEADAAMAILDNPPTTLAGASALLHYIAEAEADRWPLISDDAWVDAPWLQACHEMLAEAMEGISGSAAVAPVPAAPANVNPLQADAALNGAPNVQA